MINNPREPPTVMRRMPDFGGNDLYGNIASKNFGSTAGQSSNMPPPLPPRPQSNVNSYNWNNTTTNGYGYSPYNNSFNSNPYFNSTGGYYGQNYGFGGRPSYLDYHNNGESDFMRLAEQNTRNVFQSAESVVNAFTSVSQMFESTLTAFYSSFRAVLGVADQFARLKVNMQNIFTTLALFRFCRWLWRRLLVLLRLRPSTFAEQAWNTGNDLAAASDILPNIAGSPKPSVNWPLLAFFAVAVGGPMLIYKLMAKLISSVEESRKWAAGQGEHYSAIALYEFASSSQQELSIQAGQQLRLAPKELQPQVKGWLLASVDGKQVGLVPANYIRILGKQSGGGSLGNVPNEEKYLPTSTSSPMFTNSAKVDFTETYENAF